MNIRFITILTACLSASAQIYAEQGRDELDKVVVSATRTPQAVGDTLAPVIVIDKEEIERSQAIDIADLLRFNAGIDIGRNGGPGQVTSAFIRGAESNHTLVLVDGVRINPGTIGGAAIWNIDPNLIEQIEIVKGPRSVLYGNNAIGGVINIITKRGKSAGTSSSAYLSAGSFDTKRGSASIHHRSNNIYGGIDLSGISTRGFPSRTESNIDRGYINQSFNAYVGKEFGIVDIELSHWQADSNTEYLDFFLSPLDQDQTNSTSTLKALFDFSPTVDTTAKLSFVTDDISQNQSADFVRTKNWILDVQNDIELHNNLLSVGVLLTREDNESASFGTTFDEDTDTNGLFVQDQITLGDHQLNVGGRLTDHSDFGSEFTWSVEYAYKLSNSTRIGASAGRAFRAPDATDRFGFGGNVNLDPEVSQNIELNLQHQFSPNGVLEVAAFRNKIDDLISFNDPDGFLGPEPGENVNIDEATIEGLEIGYQGYADNLTYSASVIFQNPVNDQTGRTLARRAKRSLTSNIAYRSGKLSYSADMLLTSRRNDSEFSTEVNGGYLLVNTGVNYQVTPQHSLALKVENLFDNQYETAANFNTPDRSYFIEFRYTGDN